MRSSILWTTVLCIVLGLLFYTFVFLQRPLISDIFGFLFIIITLVAFSFLVSAMEAAFSKAHLNSEIQQLIDHERNRHRTEYDQIYTYINENGHALMPPNLRKQFRDLQKKTDVIEEKEKSLQSHGRSLYIGSLASLSVFLNISIAILLPRTLISTPLTNLVEIPIPILSHTLNPFNISLSLQWIDITGSKTLIFVCSTIPVLILGKIIPKEIGAHKDIFFAYKLNRLARGIVFVFGPITKGLVWPIGLFTK